MRARGLPVGGVSAGPTRASGRCERDVDAPGTSRPRCPHPEAASDDSQTHNRRLKATGPSELRWGFLLFPHDFSFLVSFRLLPSFFVARLPAPAASHPTPPPTTASLCLLQAKNVAESIARESTRIQGGHPPYSPSALHARTHFFCTLHPLPSSLSLLHPTASTPAAAPRFNSSWVLAVLDIFVRLRYHELVYVPR